MDDRSRRARQIVETTAHMTVATADASGKPWSSPVFFAHDERFRLYWVSFSGAVHCTNIRIRPQVAITILGEPPHYYGDGVYFDAVATELHDPAEVERAIQIRRTRHQETRFAVSKPADVLGDAAWRIYRADPLAIYISAEDTINGQRVTTRVPVTLPMS
jgi:uncharacterized protein YhbP (UPF0306 family)